MKNLSPYLINAHIYWMEDSGVRPHLVIASGPKVKFPPPIPSSPFVVFNISGESVKNFQLDEDGVSFYARFGGKEFQVYAPLESILQLRSKDGQIAMNLQPNYQVESTLTPEAEPKVVVEPEAEREFVPLYVINTGGKSNGVRCGKLNLFASGGKIL